ncbi:MAG: hypothetical protein AB7L17_04100 [Ilumatobacteraceae bacterium]
MLARADLPLTLPTTRSAPFGYQAVEFLDIPAMHDARPAVESTAPAVRQHVRSGSPPW